MWPNDLLTLGEVAVYLRISRVTVWRWCKQGTIPAIRIGRSWRVHRDDLLDLSKSYASQAEAKKIAEGTPENGALVHPTH
jgi:excisionase family DNA binding protein